MYTPLLLLLLLKSLPYSQGDSLADKVRDQAESLKEALRNLSNNPKANDVLNRLKAHTGTCFSTVDDVVETIETSTHLVENVADEIDEMFEMVEIFMMGTTGSLANFVKLMRAVDVLVDKLVPEISETCGAASVDEFQTIHSLALIIAELSWTDGLLNTQYQEAGDVLATVANFLSEYSHPHYDCTGHQNLAIVKVVAPVIVDLANLYRLLWGNVDQMTGDLETFGQKIMVSRN